ncbi:hypothetical protein TKK_0017751 [Trichogramma kaykai]|uniref:Small ribosomal subunit protein uS5m n=1 Tax=Trichogramma kaykai TaxID=54128 RepID=A0ABD2W1X0_9HYME
MAFRVLKAYNSLTKVVTNHKFTVYGTSSNVNKGCLNALAVNLPITSITRSASFFTKYSAEALWKSVTSVSNAGKQRGRARQTRGLQRNLNRGQYIGVGKINMLWPGLTGPIMRGTNVVKQQRLPDDPDRETKLYKIRDSTTRGKKTRTHPLERGWSGAKIGGRSLGPPDPVNDETFEGFDSRVIEHKIVNHMTGNLGRKRGYSSLVVVGNGKGLFGFALGRAPDAKGALRLGRNRAGMKLMYVPLYKDHTVYHDFYARFGNTKVFVSKKPEGYGFTGHRAIKCACDVIGIKDLHAEVEGANRYLHIIKAFFIGLLKQKTHQQLAEEKKLHLVEFKKENLNYPEVVASPGTVRKSEEVPSTETLDFVQYVLGGKVILQKPEHPPFYHTYRSYKLRRTKDEIIRNHDKVRIRLLAEYGEFKSHLTDRFPEAKPFKWSYKIKREAERLKAAEEEVY